MSSEQGLLERDLVDALRQRGLRMTTQRQLVLDAVRRLKHPTPERIHAEVAAKAAGVNITTVYRTLDLLTELGLVTHTHLGHGAPVYHLAGRDRHVHLVCHDCENVTEVDIDVVEQLARNLRRDHDFELEVEHVSLFGRCVDCRTSIDA